MRQSLFLGMAILLFSLLYLILHHEESSWIATEAGAVHADAYSSFDSNIDIHTAYKQEGICKNYLNDLSDTSEAGIGGAVEDAAFYSRQTYYFYNVEAYMTFHGPGGTSFRLSLYQSPKYFRLPRIVPDKHIILDRLQSLSMAAQVELSQTLNDNKGDPRQFTPKELSDLLEKTAGKQEFDLSDWVLTTFFDQSSQQFMACVPEASKLKEHLYETADQAAVQRSLEAAESGRDSAQRKLIHESFWLR